MTDIAKAVSVIDYGRNPALHNKLSTKPGSFVDKHILRRQNQIPEFCKYNEIIN